jgi:hypothetical protein
MLDESISAYFPSWLVRLDAPPSSRDPLGLQAHAMRQADQLLPGLNVFTSRARYYTFLCWALARAQAGAPPRAHLERVLRLERLLVLCEALWHEDEPDACSYIGRRRGRRFVGERAGAGLWELPTRILKNQAGNGALRLYRTSLADLGLVEEDELEEGLGLRLTERGSQLARQYEKAADDGIAAWAIGGGEGQRKRRDTLCEAARGMCLSGRIGAYERRYLVDALLGDEGHAVDRRETVQILFEHDLLTPAPVGQDLASADPDLVADDGGRPAEEAADSETRGNWAVIRRALELPPSDRLRAVQVAGAYQLAALALNALLASALDPVQQYGRVSLRAWRQRIAERAGSGFETSSALAWAGHRPAVRVAEDLLAGDGRPWPEVAALATELLLRLGLDERYLRWLAEDPAPLVERALVWSRDAGTEPAGEMVTRLLPELVHHHAEVSARKGKGEWIVIDGPDLVRADPRPLRLMLHSLRFAQLQQIAADLHLRPEDVAHET